MALPAPWGYSPVVRPADVAGHSRSRPGWPRCPSWGVPPGAGICCPGWDVPRGDPWSVLARAGLRCPGWVSPPGLDFAALVGCAPRGRPLLPRLGYPLGGPTACSWQPVLTAQRPASLEVVLPLSLCSPVCPPLPAPPGPFQKPSAFVSWTAEQSAKGVSGCRFPDFYQMSSRTAPSGARCPRWQPGRYSSGPAGPFQVALLGIRKARAAWRGSDCTKGGEGVLVSAEPRRRCQPPWGGSCRIRTASRGGRGSCILPAPRGAGLKPPTPALCPRRSCGHIRPL